MALKAVCVMKGDGATQGVINLCQEVGVSDACAGVRDFLTCCLPNNVL